MMSVVSGEKMTVEHKLEAPALVQPVGNRRVIPATHPGR